MRFGPGTGPVVVMALPLFEEANRVRAFAVSILRALAARGVAGALPDLPGQGESLVVTDEVRLGDLREAFAAAVAMTGGVDGVLVAAIRSGALAAGNARANAQWCLSPQSGPSLHRELMRMRSNADGQPPPYTLADSAPVEIAGNLLAPALLAELASASDEVPDSRTRVVRLEGDPRSADRMLAGAALWRRAEPGGDPVLMRELADDLARWVRTCAGC